MPLSAMDERTALVVADLQNGVLSRPVAPEPETGTTAEVLELLRISRSGAA